ncbi:hypothetical protein [Ancylobacter terrae]
MVLAHLWTHFAAMMRGLDRRLTDSACQHGRYCVADEKIRQRAPR